MNKQTQAQKMAISGLKNDYKLQSAVADSYQTNN